MPAIQAEVDMKKTLRTIHISHIFHKSRISSIGLFFFLENCRSGLDVTELIRSLPVLPCRLDPSTHPIVNNAPKRVVRFPQVIDGCLPADHTYLWIGISQIFPTGQIEPPPRTTMRGMAGAHCRETLQTLNLFWFPGKHMVGLSVFSSPESLPLFPYPDRDISSWTARSCH